MEAVPYDLSEVKRLLDDNLQTKVVRAARATHRANSTTVASLKRLIKAAETLSKNPLNTHSAGSVLAQVGDLETQLRGREKSWNYLLDTVHEDDSKLADSVVEAWYVETERVSEAADEALNLARGELGESERQHALVVPMPQGANGGQGQEPQGAYGGRLVVWKSDSAKRPKETMETDTPPWRFKVFAKKFRNYMKAEHGMREPTNSTCYCMLFDLLSAALASRLDNLLSEELDMEQNLAIEDDLL